MPIKALLFDLDDTLIIEEQAVGEAFLAVAQLASRRYPIIPEEGFVEAVRRRARELWYSLPSIEYCLRIGISSWEGLWAEFSGHSPDQKLLREIRDYFQTYSWLHALREFDVNDMSLALELAQAYKDEREKRYLLFPDTVDCLECLHRHYKLALVTNGTPDLQQKKIVKGCLGSFFRYDAISAQIGCAKPEKEIFTAALKRLAVRAGEAVMIGDGLKTDIKGANSCGITSVWLNRNRKINDSDIKPAFEIASLAALPALLEKIP